MLKGSVTLRIIRIGALALALAALAWLLLARTISVEAGGVVSNCANDVEFTQKLGGGGLVTFNCGSATITLGATKLITQNTTIDGGNVVALSGGGTTRLFLVSAGATFTLMNITIRDGSYSAGDGGAIRNDGTLNVIGSKFYSNTTSANWSGSAIYSTGPLNISDSEFAYNTGGGGAVKPRSGTAVTTISGSTFHHNQSNASAGGGYGGAMQLHDAPFVTIYASSFYRNSAGARGGAIVVGSASSLTISNSQILSNTALSGGGGIYAYGALTVISSTLAHNDADASGGGVVVESSATISKTRIYSNTATIGGGGIAALAIASLHIANSRIDENYVYGDGGGIHSRGTLVITGTNIQYNTTDGGFDTYGGGIYQEGASLTMFQSYALYNRAKYGGGIHLVNSTASLNESGASFNSATVGDGGGLRSVNSSLLLNFGAANFNQAATVGGGISHQGTLTVTAQAQVYYNLASRNGGGIFQSSGTMTIISSTLGNNTVCCAANGGVWGMGGGIYNAGGSVTLRNALVDRNRAYARGGGILNFDTLTVDRSTIARNFSDGGDDVTQTYGGGGIYNFGTATVLSSTIRDNYTYSLDGGGFYNGWYANATLSSVTLSGNRAAQDGGGLKNNLGTATLTNVTFSGNGATQDGGGVFSDHGQTNLTHVTFSGNSANNGGGIYNLTVWTTRTVSLQNSIIANSPSGYNCASPINIGGLIVISRGYNLSDDASFTANGFCPSFAGTDQSYTNPRLGVLARNGGPTTGLNLEPMLTHLPVPINGFNPAIDNIPPGVNGCNTLFQIDQRSVRRPQGTACDIGAVEYRVGDVTPWLWLPLVVR